MDEFKNKLDRVKKDLVYAKTGQKKPFGMKHEEKMNENRNRSE